MSRRPARADVNTGREARRTGRPPGLLGSGYREEVCICLQASPSPEMSGWPGLTGLLITIRLMPSRAASRTRSAASPRTFAAGARLIAEGNQADYVIVILSGRTKISVEENGRERILAERGPGQLVGERAVLQISVRSANVTALDTVQALVVRT